MTDPRMPGESRVQGCLTVFVFLWALAAVAIGGLMAAVSGYCGALLITEPVTYGYWVPVLIVGCLLCWHGVYLLRRSSGASNVPPPRPNVPLRDRPSDKDAGNPNE